MGTNVLNFHSDLIRRGWMKEGLIRRKNTAFFAPYTGGSAQHICYTVNDKRADIGNNVIFDYDGYLTGKAVEGFDTAYGKGEVKKKFSDKVTIGIVRFPVKNGRKFNAKAIDNLASAEHADSREKLADVYIKFDDQQKFDVLQQKATDRVILEDSFNYKSFIELEEKLMSGDGYTKMDSLDPSNPRMPLKPFKFADGREMFLLMIDVHMKAKFFQDPDVLKMLSEADIRGNDNRLLKGLIGTIGSFVVVQAPLYFGETRSRTVGDFVSAEGYSRPKMYDVQAAGLRTYTAADKSFVPESWRGDSLTPGAKKFSRGLILGQGAMMKAIGMDPDYKIQFSQDFKMSSESCLEVWSGYKICKYYAENGDYYIPEAGVSHGVIAVDCQID